jgi:hypothetical protein
MTVNLVTRKNIDFSPEAEEVIAELSVLMGNVSEAEVLRRSLGIALLLRRRMAGGWKVLLERAGTYQEVVDHG